MTRKTGLYDEVRAQAELITALDTRLSDLDEAHEALRHHVRALLDCWTHGTLQPAHFQAVQAALAKCEP